MKNVIKTFALSALTLSGTAALQAKPGTAEVPSVEETTEEAVAAPDVENSPAPEKPGTAVVPSVEGDTSTKNIVEIASGMTNFTTLVKAVQAAGLADTLTGEGPFTVFAPTDEAFAKLPAGTVDDLLKAENKDKLAKILKYHVVPGKVMAADVKTMSAATAAGVEAPVVAEDGKVTFGGQNVIKTDVEASNGVIHWIDGVAMPE